MWRRIKIAGCVAVASAIVGSAAWCGYWGATAACLMAGAPIGWTLAGGTAGALGAAWLASKSFPETD